jgi:hypothetical protein
MSADIIKGLGIARSKATELRALTSLFDRHDKGQRRMATRIIDEIDKEIEEWRDREDCHSEDLIDEGLRA